MDITLLQIKGPNDFEIPVLQKRAQESSKSLKTRHYKALLHDKEVAFVSLDRWPELNQMVIYEIFVPSPTRCQGIGTVVLGKIERISLCEGFSRVRLRSSPLDDEITNEDLFNWYSRRGYVRDSDIPNELYKIIGGKYWREYDKFSKAIYILANDAEDIRSGLLRIWQEALRKIDDQQLPNEVQKDFLWIRNKLHKYHEEWPGQLEDLKQNEKMDPTFRVNYAHLYPNPVEATLRRIRRKTGAKIARRIYSIYEVLKAKRCY